MLTPCRQRRVNGRNINASLRGRVGHAGGGQSLREFRHSPGPLRGRGVGKTALRIEAKPCGNRPLAARALYAQLAQGCRDRDTRAMPRLIGAVYAPKWVASW